MKSIWFTFLPSVYVIPVALAFFVYFLSYGTLYITYDYTQAPPYSMTNAEYSLLKGTRGIASFLAMILLIQMQKLKQNEYIFALVGLCSISIQYTFYGLSSNKILLYIALFLGIPGKWIFPLLRKFMADKVPEELTGSLFAIPAWIECGGVSIASIIYTTLYRIDPFHSGWIFWGISNGFVFITGKWNYIFIFDLLYSQDS